METIKGIDRVMIFIELVKGCENDKCPSFKTLCSVEDTKLEYMTEDTLKGIVQDIMNHRYMEDIGRIDIWPYGCGDSLLHPQLDKMAEILKSLPYKKTIAIDSNCWKENTGWANDMAPVILFKEDSFDPNKLKEITEKWNLNCNGPRFGFILKTLTPDVLESIRGIQANHCMIKARSFHYVPIGSNRNYKDITKYGRQDIFIDPSIPIIDIPLEDKKAIRIMYNYDGSLRRCLVSTTKKTCLEDFLSGDLSDCDQCFPYMSGEQLLIFDDRILRIKKARCVSDKG